MQHDLIKFLFLDSQEEMRLDSILEEVAGVARLEVKKKPLAAALKSLGIKTDVELTADGYELSYDEYFDYSRDMVRLTSPDGVNSLAELGWVVASAGDVSGPGTMEVPEFRIKFFEVHTAEPSEGEGDEDLEKVQQHLQTAGMEGKTNELYGESLDVPDPDDDLAEAIDRKKARKARRRKVYRPRRCRAAEVGAAYNAAINEAFSGTSVVAWQGRIERQLGDMINEYEESNNPGYVDKLRAILNAWRANPLTGSVNVETVQALLGPIELAAVDSWKLQDYFSKLKDSLKVLTASLEELPPMPDGAPAGAERDMMEPMGDLPPLSDFGPSDEPPADTGDELPNPDETTDEGPEPAPEAEPTPQP